MTLTLSTSFALFPCHAGTKTPLIKWKEGSTFDPATIQAWREQGYNLAIDCNKSGLITIDVDASKVTREQAWNAYTALCTSWGLSTPPQPMTQSARGGWHIQFKRPDHLAATDLRGGGTLVKISDVRPLEPGEKDGEVIGFKNRGYCIAPGSYLSTAEGDLPYLAMPDAPTTPPLAPAGLIEAIKLPPLKITEHQSSGEWDHNEVLSILKHLHRVDHDYVTRGNQNRWKSTLAVRNTGIALTDDLYEFLGYEPGEESKFYTRWERHDRTSDRTFNMQSLKQAAIKSGWAPPQKSAQQMFSAVTNKAKPPALPPGAVSLIGGPRVELAAPEYSEIEVADRFAADYSKHLKFVTARRSWIVWNGKRWHKDETGQVADMVRLHCRRESALYASTPGTTAAQARSLCSNKTVSAVLNLAAIDQRFATKASEWDQDPWLLGTPEGVVDLRTGTLRDAQPTDKVTKSTKVSPNGDCPTWLAFLARATSGDVEMQSYLQRMAGYFLTGTTREQSLHFAFGPGRTGKGTFMHAISAILADYHVTTAIETLTESRSDRHPTEVAALQGTRLVTCSETERGRHWAESRIKQFTGGDEISARFMGKDFFEFLPTFKLMISGNYKPHLRPDTAMRRRFQLIPFLVTIPEREQDQNLGAKLEREWPGILAWMIAGALAWQQDGLNPPAAIRNATEEYMNDEADDVLSAWLDECCDRSDTKTETKHGDLYRSYKIYAEQAGERAVTSAQLGKEVKRLGFELRRTGGARLVVGLKLKPPPPPSMPLPRVAV